MAVNRALRQALLAKRKFSKQRLSQLAAQRKAALPMSTDMAVYAIAHESGLDLSKFLTGPELIESRDLIAKLRPADSGPSARTARPVKSKAKPVHVTIAGMKIDALPGLTVAHAREAKEMSEKVYPALYVFENSLRDVIERVMRAAYAADWWLKVPAPVQRTAAQNKSDEKKDSWHGKRGERELDYVLLTELLSIIRAHWELFKTLFPSQTWLDGIVTDLNVSRRVVAHMNPLAPDDIAGIDVAFRKWAKQLTAMGAQLP